VPLVVSPDLSTRDAVGVESLRDRAVELLVRKDIKVTSAPIAAEILRRLGFDARLVVEDEIDLSPDRIVLARGSPLWYRRALRRLDSLQPSTRPCLIIWHTEALPMPSAAGLPSELLTVRELAKIALRDSRINDQYSNARYLRRLSSQGIATVVAVANRSYQAYLAEHGISTEFVPVGYHPSYGRLLGLVRDIDVLFLGEYRVRRRRHILRRLKREGTDVVLLGSQSPTRGYWGDARTELLNRTKVLLHLPRYPGHLSDRILMGMANGALVVSEPMYLPDPYEPGVHYVESSVDQMAETVRRYLADEESRQRITDAAYRFVTQELRLEGTYARLMELAAARAPVICVPKTAS
jgi:glycosyltransferase involved in cell wall biosynthesis